jgi:hypothetical protein
VRGSEAEMLLSCRNSLVRFGTVCTPKVSFSFSAGKLWLQGVQGGEGERESAEGFCELGPSGSLTDRSRSIILSGTTGSRIDVSGSTLGS